MKTNLKGQPAVYLCGDYTIRQLQEIVDDRYNEILSGYFEPFETMNPAGEPYTAKPCFIHKHLKQSIHTTEIELHGITFLVHPGSPTYQNKAYPVFYSIIKGEL